MFVQFPYPDPAWGDAVEATIPASLDVDVMAPVEVERYFADASALPPVTVSAALHLVDEAGIAPAIRDVTYRLMHDLSDTPDDIRDAAALAPLALIKLAQQSARFLAERPKRTLLGLAFISVVLAVIAKRRLSPRQRERRHLA